MSGLPSYNKAAFYRAAAIEEQKGRIVLNPAILPEGLKHHEYMQICMPMLALANELILLPGWGGSRGAKAEHEYALCLGLVVRYPDGIASYPGSVAKQTEGAVCR